MLISSLLLAAASAAPHTASHHQADPCAAITTVNVIDIVPGRTREARLYYQRGWAAAREIALERGDIADYRLMVSQSGVSEEPEIILETTYKDRAQFERAEDAFRAIFEELALPRPLLIEGLARDAIVGPIKGAEDYRSVFAAGGNCGVPGHPMGE